jgi:hypothetical protein
MWFAAYARVVNSCTGVAWFGDTRYSCSAVFLARSCCSYESVFFICRLCNSSFENLGHLGSNDWLNNE